MTTRPVSEQALREEVRHALSTAEMRSALGSYRAAAAAGEDPDPRPAYRLLGARRLLAVHWPREYGGRGQPPIDHAAVVEELTLAGVPDTLHTLSVQIVGSFLVSAATVAQRARWLPPLAAGELGAAVLYSEPEAGSDLTALSTRAEPAPDDGWRLTGRKVYGVQTRYAGVGLCLARTADAATPYQGLTLFLVPMDAPGVEVRTLPTGADEQYADVRLAGVRVGPDAVVGQVGRAWPLVTAALALERTGVDTAAKARRWLDAAVAAVAAVPTGGAGPAGAGELGVPLGRLTARVDAARLMARSAAAAGAALDPGTGARTKVWCAETAQDVAWWATDVLGPATLGPDPPAGGLLGAAYREAAGLTISAGTSEVLLDLVAAGLSDGTGPDGPVDPVAARVALAVHALAAGGDPQWTELAAVGLFGFTVPVPAGGLDLGLAVAATACAELGRAGVDGGLLDTLTAADRLPPGELLDRCLAGRLRAAVVDEAGRGRHAALADVLLVADRLVRRDDPGVAVRSSPSTVDIVRTGAGGPRLRVVPPTADRVRTAGWLVGLAAGGLALTVRRVRDRRQFGRAVADNQVVAHRLARSAIGVDAVRSLVGDAAVRADRGDPEAGRAAAGALAAAAELAADVLRSGVQLHGAYGTTTGAPIARLAGLLPLVAGRSGRAPALWREAARTVGVPPLRAVGS
jgi:alkylation response protein AidB-like acyl-CoA dehydrogenase